MSPNPADDQKHVVLSQSNTEKHTVILQGKMWVFPVAVGGDYTAHQTVRGGNPATTQNTYCGPLITV